MSGYSFPQMEQHFQDIERGMARLDCIRHAIHEADLAQDTVWMFWFRYDYIEESIFCGDRYYAMIMFPELLKLWDDHPELQEDYRISHSLLVTFRWIVEAAPEFPQISREEIDSYFRLFKRRLQEQACSLNIYYMKRGLFYMEVDRGIAAANFYRFLEEPVDAISDGKPLCQNHQVEFYLYLNEVEKAIQAAEPIFAGKLRSNALPHSTYHKFCRYYLRTGEWDKAEEFARKLQPRVSGDLYHLHNIGTMMSIYSMKDVQEGIRLFNKHYPLYRTSKNPWLRFYFVTGASHLFDRIHQDGLSLENVHILEESSLSQAVREQDTATVSAFFRREAEEQAKRFDARNGTDCYMQRVKRFR